VTFKSYTNLKLINNHFLYVLFHVLLHGCERLIEEFMEDVSRDVVVDLPHVLGSCVIMNLEVLLVLFSVEDDVVDGLGVHLYSVFPLGLLILYLFRFELNVGWLLGLQPEGEGIDTGVEWVLILRLLGSGGIDRFFQGLGGSHRLQVIIQVEGDRCWLRRGQL
jgi:hypothetical protein